MIESSCSAQRRKKVWKRRAWVLMMVMMIMEVSTITKEVTTITKEVSIITKEVATITKEVSTITKEVATLTKEIANITEAFVSPNFFKPNLTPTCMSSKLCEFILHTILRLWEMWFF